MTNNYAAVTNMQIGQVVTRTRLSMDAIRSYEKRGLLAKPHRSEGGFRLCAADDVGALLFIRQAQQLGFSPHEIQDLLPLRASRLEACLPVRELLDQKLWQVRAKIG